MQPREVQFPMPWGHMAAQEWGDPNSRKKVLALHGWMDNSNSFQKLCPLLPSDLHIVAIDQCGHGFSTHKPIGCAYTIIEFAMDLRRLVNHLDWKEFAIIAHSMGAMVSLLFVGIFPELVTHLVSLDMLYIMTCSRELMPEMTAKNITDLLAFEKKHSQAPVYKNLNEVVQRRMFTTPDSLTPESAKIILERATTDYQGGVVLRTDPRLKSMRTVNFSYGDQLEFIKRYKGRLLVIIAESAEPQRLKDTPIQEFVTTYQESCQDFQLVRVKGRHTVHLDEPERVSGPIIDFLKTYSGIKLSKPVDAKL